MKDIARISTSGAFERVHFPFNVKHEVPERVEHLILRQKLLEV